MSDISVSVGLSGTSVILTLSSDGRTISAACTPRAARMFAMMLIEVADTLDFEEEDEDETPERAHGIGSDDGKQ